MNNYKDLIDQFSRENALDIMFLTKYGSSLYGTNTPASDLDIKGIFLPKRDDLILGRAPKCFTRNSSSDNVKNTADDFDFEVYSLHNFLNMAQRGDTGALDMLFAFTNKEAVVYIDSRWQLFIDNIASIFNPTKTRAFLGYAQGQARKYSIKGDQLNALIKLRDFINELDDEERLRTYFDDIIKNCSLGTYICEDQSGNKVRSLRMLGSVHQETIFLKEFKTRIERLYSRYGNRSHASAAAEGADWKALSHCERCIYEAKELLLTGKIEFPLKNKNYLLEVKEGKIPYEKLLISIEKHIEEVDEIINNYSRSIKFDPKKVDEMILSLYED